MLDLKILVVHINIVLSLLELPEIQCLAHIYHSNV